MAADDQFVQWRDPTSLSEDEDNMGEVSDSGHDVSEQDAYSELVSHGGYITYIYPNLTSSFSANIRE